MSSPMSNPELPAEKLASCFPSSELRVATGLFSGNATGAEGGVTGAAFFIAFFSLYSFNSLELIAAISDESNSSPEPDPFSTYKTTLARLPHPDRVAPRQWLNLPPKGRNAEAKISVMKNDIARKEKEVIILSSRMVAKEPWTFVFERKRKPEED